MSRGALLFAAFAAGCSGPAPPAPKPAAPIAQPAPPPVAVPDAPVQVAASRWHSCARFRSGRVWCWGSNTYGQLGDGSLTVRDTAVRVAGLEDAADIAVGHEFSCAVRRTGAVACWGRNWWGELGDAAGGVHPAPRAVPGVTGAVQVTAGHVHACVRRGDGTVWCWGGNQAGQMGRAPDDQPAAPRQISVDPMGQVAAGARYTCGVSTGGRMACWGPEVIWQPEISDAIEVIAAAEEWCVRRRGAELRCERAPWQRTPPPADLGIAAAGERVMCFARTDGSVECWDGIRAWKPIDGVAAPTALAVGFEFACAIADDLVRCWGRNDQGQLGDGTRAKREKAVTVRMGS
ncbi:MAG TPA: hypothetical protein VML75_21985 [Kofleriaceae bacterium]|nr:hypothetical protein [Kofleriaceae bacterium]